MSRHRRQRHRRFRKEWGMSPDQLFALYRDQRRWGDTFASWIERPSSGFYKHALWFACVVEL